MNKFSLKWLLSLLFVFVLVACSDSNEPSNHGGGNNEPDTTTGGNNDPDDTVICYYNDIVINTSKFNPITKKELLGTWMLEAYINTADCSVQPRPADASENALTITFHENDSISGFIDVNCLIGNYLLNKNKISFSDIILTEICCDSEYGEVLAEALNGAGSITMTNNKLIIFLQDKFFIFKHKQEDEVEQRLEGTKWKLIGFYNIETTEFIEAEPKWKGCYHLDFYTDTTAWATAAANDLHINLLKKPIVTFSTGIYELMGTAELFAEAMDEVDSYKVEVNKLKLFYNQGKNYLLYKKRKN